MVSVYVERSSRVTQCQEAHAYSESRPLAEPVRVTLAIDALHSNEFSVLNVERASSDAMCLPRWYPATRA